jgi:hypothetical protein
VQGGPPFCNAVRRGLSLEGAGDRDLHNPHDSPKAAVSGDTSVSGWGRQAG